MKYSNQGFTLIELLVSISILGVIMISVFTIFFLSNDINNKTDISRSMQENVKHIMESISEDVRKSEKLQILTSGVDCTDFSAGIFIGTGSKMCAGSQYYLATYDGTNYIRQIDMSQCVDKQKACILIKDGQPLSNSWVEFENLEFTLFDQNPQKIIVKMTLRPSSKKGIKPELIKENTLHLQTTLSKRMY